MELGLAGFALGKWGLSHWDWDLVTGNGKKCLKIKKEKKMEMDLIIAKWDLEKKELGNGIGTVPPSGTSI